MKATRLTIFAFLLIQQSASQEANEEKKFTDSSFSYKPERNKKKQELMLGGHIVVYSGITAGLYSSWYKDHPFGKFRFVNDNKQWLQVDKAGHAWSGYIQGKMGIAVLRWAGVPDKKVIWIGGLTGFAYQNLVEIADGLSAPWGFSWGDYAADIAGSSLLISQELGWKEQRILYKLSLHKKHYPDKILSERANEIYGSSLPGRLLDDYNAQTYWLSLNLKSFFKNSKLPPWLNIAAGYGAEGMFGKLDNKWTGADGIEYNRTDIKRYRQFYISPDIDFSRIKTKSKLLKTGFFILNSFKLPAPALEFSNGRTRVRWIIF